MILFKQMRNQRRHNAWIFIELVIISCLMWYTVDDLYKAHHVGQEPLGFGIDDVYHLEVHYIERQDSTGTPLSTKKLSSLQILDSLQAVEGIESACGTYLALPYLDYNLNSAYEVSEYVCMCYSRVVTPDYMKVFRVGDANGCSNDSLAQVLADDKLIISTNWYPDSLKGNTVVGRKMWPCSAPYLAKEVGASLPHRVKRHRWASDDYDHVYHCLNEELIGRMIYDDIAIDICFRTRPGEGQEVRRRIMQMAEKELYTPDAVIVDITPMSYYRERTENYGDSYYRSNILMCSFLVFNIVLCILGTFWHRTLERRSEIAIMRALGASSMRVYLRTVGEGVALLFCAFGVGMGISYLLVLRGMMWKSFYSGYTLERFFSTQGITLAIMLAAVEFAAIVPALLAKHTTIASAIREE